MSLRFYNVRVSNKVIVIRCDLSFSSTSFIHPLGTFKSSVLRGRLGTCKDGYGDDDGDDDDDGDVVVVVGAVFNLTVQQRYLHIGAALKFQFE